MPDASIFTGWSSREMRNACESAQTLPWTMNPEAFVKRYVAVVPCPYGQMNSAVLRKYLASVVASQPWPGVRLGEYIHPGSWSSTMSLASMMDLRVSTAK